MKFPDLKLKKDKLPPLKSMRPPIFNVSTLWFVSLGISLVVLLITMFVGFQLFYYQYFEVYKESKSPENPENLINISKLKSAIEKRNSFINQEVSLPRDPAL